MNFTIPQIIKKTEIDKLPLNLNWKKADFDRYIKLCYKNQYLEEQLSEISYKAAIGLATSLTEWIFWRLNKIQGIEILVPIINALWASVIDPAYLKTFYFQYAHELEELEEPETIEVNLLILSFLLEQYTDSKYKRSFINGCLVNLITFTQSLLPDKKIFNNWLFQTMDRLINTFPFSDQNENDIHSYFVYDLSNDKPLPREFFFDDLFIYKEPVAKELLNKYLNNLDYKTNYYLSSPEEMLLKNFNGKTPYMIK